MRLVSILLLALGAVSPVAAGTIGSGPASVPVTGAGGSYVGSFSADGKFLLFFSHANNLVTNDNTAPFLDVFARNLSNGVLTLVSVATNGSGGGDDNSPFATLSTNGLVAFESRAGNLVTNDTNGLSDVFVRDLLAGTTTLVSVNSNGTRSAAGMSTTPLLSLDGRRVIFESTATNIVTGDTNGQRDVFVRDLVARTTTMVSRDATNAGFSPGPAECASISADGRYVAFEKRAVNNLFNLNRQSVGEIYVRDLDTGTTIWASADANTNFAATFGYPYRFYNPVISADGRFVAFFGEGPFYVGGAILVRHDLVSGATERLAIGVTNAFGIPMSADGRVLAWISAYASGNAGTGLYLWDEASGTNLWLSPGPFSVTAPALSANGNRLAWFTNFVPATTATFIGLRVFDRVTGSNQFVHLATTNGASALPTEPSVPALSPDGQLVAFETDDARLVPGDDNAASDVFLRDLDTGAMELVSVASPARPPASAAGMATLTAGALSADGRFLAFSALDGNLAPGDTNRYADVFVCDLLTGGLVAASASLVPAPGGGTALLFPTNEANTAPVISADGSVVVFRRWKTAASSVNKLLWRDLSSNQPVIVFGQNEVSPTNTIAVNHNGRLIAFESLTSANALGILSLPDTNNLFDVFVRDMVTGTNSLASVNHDGTSAGNGASVQPVLSPDGQWLGFLSRATDLTADAIRSNTFNAFVRHLPTAQTRLLSWTNLIPASGYNSYGITFSADSRYLVFGVPLGFGGFTNVYRHDLLADATAQVCGGCQNPSVSGDGRFIAYDSVGDTQPGGPTRLVAVKDMATGFESILSLRTNSTLPAYQNPYSTPGMFPQISRDGRYVLFSSRSAELAATDTNKLTDLFAHDRVTQRTFHLTVNSQGTAGASGISTALQMAGDSRTAVFQSHAGDLVATDYNFRRDIFVLRLAEPDADGDGMDDDWEMAYFSTLARDGTGDFDGDGSSDRHEFEAHTDPTNTGSVFRVISLTHQPGYYRLFWGSEPGRIYQLQYRNGDVRETDWRNYNIPFTAVSTTSSTLVHADSLATNRFYRMLLLQ